MFLAIINNNFHSKSISRNNKYQNNRTIMLYILHNIFKYEHKTNENN